MPDSLVTFFRQASKRCLLIGAALWIAEILSGCSVINIYDQGILTQRYYGLPIYTINSSESENTIFLESHGLGVISGLTGLSIGFKKENLLSLPPGNCSAVFINTNAEAVDFLLTEFKATRIGLDTLCIHPAQGTRNE